MAHPPARPTRPHRREPPPGRHRRGAHGSHHAPRARSAPDAHASRPRLAAKRSSASLPASSPAPIPAGAATSPASCTSTAPPTPHKLPCACAPRAFTAPSSLPSRPLDFDANCGFVYHYAVRSLENLACDSPLGDGRIRLTGEKPGEDAPPRFSVELDRIPVAAGLDALRTLRSGLEPTWRPGHRQRKTRLRRNAPGQQTRGATSIPRLPEGPAVVFRRPIRKPAGIRARTSKPPVTARSPAV